MTPKASSGNVSKVDRLIVSAAAIFDNKMFKKRCDLMNDMYVEYMLSMLYV